jgi:hypothetical protein
MVHFRAVYGSFSVHFQSIFVGRGSRSGSRGEREGIIGCSLGGIFKDLFKIAADFGGSSDDLRVQLISVDFWSGFLGQFSRDHFGLAGWICGIFHESF